MPFTDEQFDKFIEMIGKVQESRELLIRIDENTKNSHLSFEKHLIDDTAHQATAEKAINSLHQRVDWLTISGVLAIVFFGFSLWLKH